MLVLAVSLPSVGQGIYKWTDKNGVTHYSDLPRDGAVEVEVEPAQTFSAPGATGTDNNDAFGAGGTSGEESAYKSLTINSPSMEETIWNTGGNVKVSVSVRPALQPGHRITLYLNDKSMGDLPEKMNSTTLMKIPRGTHTLRAEVRDAFGQSQISAEGVTFYYKQTAANTGRPQPTPLPARRVVR